MDELYSKAEKAAWSPRSGGARRVRAQLQVAALRRMLGQAKGQGAPLGTFLVLSLLSSKRLRDFKAEHTRGSSEIRQLKSNTSFK